jgi:hypothetical protein
MDITSLAVPK